MSVITWVLDDDGGTQFSFATYPDGRISALFWRNNEFISASNFTMSDSENVDLAVAMASPVLKSLNYKELGALADSLERKMSQVNDKLKKCAAEIEKMAAALEANGIPDGLSKDAAEGLPKLIPDIQTRIDCPGPNLRPTHHKDCSRKHLELFDAIMHLNDEHKWSREQIADWLDALDLDLSFPSPKEQS